MIEYHKIETVFERDMSGTKKLIEGRFRNNAVEFLKDCQWDMTEKIDGMNVRIFWDGHNVQFAGRTDRADIPKYLANKLNTMFCGNENEELFEQKFGNSQVVLFGEGFGSKIQKGGLYIPDDVSFILFDVMINGRYQPRKSVEDVATSFRVDVVPVLFTGTIQDGVNFVKTNPKSTIGKASMEGVVARPTTELQDRVGNRIIVKIKAKDFV